MPALEFATNSAQWHQCPLCRGHSSKGLSHIDVDVGDHGIVSLEGKVPSQEAADRAISIARGTDGVREVKSELKVKIDN